MFETKGYGEAGASHSKRALKGFTSQSGNAQEDIDENNYTLSHRPELYIRLPQ